MTGAAYCRAELNEVLACAVAVRVKDKPDPTPAELVHVTLVCAKATEHALPAYAMPTLLLYASETEVPDGPANRRGNA